MWCYTLDFEPKRFGNLVYDEREITNKLVNLKSKYSNVNLINVTSNNNKSSCSWKEGLCFSVCCTSSFTIFYT